MDMATATKLIMLLIWPFIFMLIFYLKDKEKFKRQFKAIMKKN